MHFRGRVLAEITLVGQRNFLQNAERTQINLPVCYLDRSRVNVVNMISYERIFYLLNSRDMCINL